MKRTSAYVCRVLPLTSLPPPQELPEKIKNAVIAFSHHIKQHFSRVLFKSHLVQIKQC